MNDTEIVEKILELDGVAAAKMIKSDTNTKAVHIKVDNANYQVQYSQIPRLYIETCGYVANRNGRAVSLDSPIFRFKGDDLVEGAKELIAVLNGTSERGDTTGHNPLSHL